MSKTVTRQFLKSTRQQLFQNVWHGMVAPQKVSYKNKYVLFEYFFSIVNFEALYFLLVQDRGTLSARQMLPVKRAV